MTTLNRIHLTNEAKDKYSTAAFDMQKQKLWLGTGQLTKKSAQPPSNSAQLISIQNLTCIPGKSGETINKLT